MTKERARVCSDFAKKSSPLLLKLHECASVIQVNNVPENSRCAVTGVQLTRFSGAQLVTENMHICLDTSVMYKWFHYFRLRHFPRYMCGLILDWLKCQPWFVHTRTLDSTRLITSHWVHTYKKMYSESVIALSSD